MDIFLLLTKRPHEWPPELRDAYVRAIIDEGIAKRGRRLTEEEMDAGAKAAIDELRVKRGRDFTPEEVERQFQAALEECRKEPPLYIRLARASGYRYEPPPADAFVLRETRPGETQMDRIERRLDVCERQLVDARERMSTKVEVEAERDRSRLALEQNTAVRERIHELSACVDTLTGIVERLDLRVLSLESRVRDLEREG